MTTPRLLKAKLRTEINGLTESELDSFSELWTIKKNLNRHELLYQKGKTENNIYFIESGTLKICYDLKDQEIIVGFGYKNTFIFDLPSFFTEQPSNFHIQAIKSSQLFGINKTDFYKVLDSNLTIAKYWRTRTELILLDLVEREIDILTTSPEERYQRLQKRHPELFQHIPNKYIAAYLRMTPETLSRLKKS
ncbi:Crp/Fnr family transcriptional regulator [Lacihabitans soyangensis]|uniref:Crp/Fnr family transcriptional regulator n=1 Tax=Lacihabitans soyangensis TaxID=869394 RepID=A0AAE3H052_9BACT|nr:Crp/Fnr family transcriptional regulator [Lacihabitans soyangensis]MCP9761606.1 Crp/Fnr family transcriptional regulator [Lacihabitans soyangensis]